ncbi:MAG TPA: ABC transporter substrate-binding protein [Pyrinomonadaceae bacterium]|jgi:branched-chain amino acid transport system substrate-binding protein
MRVLFFGDAMMKKLVLLFSFILIFGAINLSAQTNESIRVGVYGDMSGPTASFGTATYNGVKLAFDEINAAGGIEGRKIEIFLADDEGRPERAKQVVEKLISEQKVQALIGEVASSNSLAAAPVAQTARIPMISPSSTNKLVTTVGDYIFRACFIDPFQGEAMAKFAFNELKLRRVAILSDHSSNYGTDLAETFKITFTRLGGKIITEQTYAQTDPEFKTQLRAIRRLKPDAIYLPGYYAQAGIIVREARQLKMNMPLLGGDGWDAPELWKLGGAALNNSYITNHFSIDNPAAEIQNFIVKYKAEFGVKPDSLAALGYDAAYILADAFRRAKSSDGKKVRDALAQTKDFLGVTGKITFNASRDTVKPALVQKLDTRNNTFVYRSTIAP